MILYHKNIIMIIRKATLEDAKWILDIRNHQDIRKLSLHDKNIIEFENHINWFEKKINNDKDLFYVIENKNIIEWYCRLDFLEKNKYLISIAINPNTLSKWLWSKLLLEVLNNLNNWDNIIAEILEENQISQKFFNKFGFIKIDNWVYKFTKKMINYWLKLWSINEDLFEDGIKSIKDWYFDFIELYVIPWKFNKESLQIFNDHNIKISIHASHSMHWFNPIWEKFENTKKVWEEIKEYIDFLNPFHIVMHPEFWDNRENLIKSLDHFYDERILIENMPKISSLKKDMNFYWYSLQQIQEIQKYHNWFCFDFAKAKSSAISQKKDIKEFSNSLIEIMDNNYFHISWFLKITEVDEHFDLWQWDQELMKYMKNKLLKISKEKNIYVVFECKKKDWIENDLRNLEYFIKL